MCVAQALRGANETELSVRDPATSCRATRSTPLRSVQYDADGRDVACCLIILIKFDAIMVVEAPSYTKGEQPPSNQDNDKKINPQVSKFLKDRGCGGKKSFLLRKFSPPHKLSYSKIKQALLQDARGWL